MASGSFRRMSKYKKTSLPEPKVLWFSNSTVGLFEYEITDAAIHSFTMKEDHDNRRIIFRNENSLSGGEEFAHISLDSSSGYSVEVLYGPPKCPLAQSLESSPDGKRCDPIFPHLSIY